MSSMPPICSMLAVVMAVLVMLDVSGFTAMGFTKIFCAVGGLGALSFGLKRYMGGPMYRGTNRIDGKTVVITGGNNGIGKETALELAKRGGRVIIASRNVKQSEAVRDEIIATTQNKNVECKKLDLASLASVRDFAEDINKSESRLDILINNSGVMMIPYKQTEDGLEMQMAVNHFGHFLLTNLLLDKLKASAPSRIVILSSIGHLWGDMDFDNLNSEKSYSKSKAYSDSKLSNLLHMRELARRLEGTKVTVNAVHPGAVNTGLDSSLITGNNNISKILLAPVKSIFYKTPVLGAQTTLTVALDPMYETVSGKYLSDCKEKAPSPRALDEEVAKKLWEMSEELTKEKKE